jgi:hypothetical protein
VFSVVRAAAVATQRRGKHICAATYSYVHNYIKKLCRPQAKVIQNDENEHVCGMGEGEARQKKYKRLKLGEITTVRVIKLPL